MKELEYLNELFFIMYWSFSKNINNSDLKKFLKNPCRTSKPFKKTPVVHFFLDSKFMVCIYFQQNMYIISVKKNNNFYISCVYLSYLKVSVEKPS